MKSLEELIPEIEAGRVVFPFVFTDVWFFKSDQGKYVFSSNRGHVTGDSVSEVLREVRQATEKGDKDYYGHSQALASLRWQVLDTSLPAGVTRGKTLLELRHEIESGVEIYPTYLERDVCEHFIRKDADVIWHISRCDDQGYHSVEGLVCGLVDGFLPVWSTEKTPAYLAELHRQEEEEQRLALLREQEEAAIDAMPSRTVEMSEREYRAYQSWLESKPKPIITESGELDDHPF